MRKVLIAIGCVCAISLLTGCATSHGKGTYMKEKGISTGFINKTMIIKGKERRYVVYVPHDYTPEKEWPLILELHGSGERGDDGLAQTEVGIGRAIRLHPDRFPCIVVLPQCPGGVWWDKAVADFETALAQTEQEYRIDSTRVYLTGLSMGGFGTWMYGASHPERFAALIPICGGGKPEQAAGLAKVPIWAFHGANDSTVSPAMSQKMVEAVKQAGGNIKYTEIPKTGHNSWDGAYGDEDTIKWLLKQRRAK